MIRTRKMAILVTAAVLGVSAAGAYAFAASDSGPSVTDGDVPRLPARVQIVDDASKPIGFVDRAALEAKPSSSYDEWLREPIPVTKTDDPNSEVVGYRFRTAGFVDLATYSDPSFDLNGLITKAQAQSAEDSQQYLNSHETSK